MLVKQSSVGRTLMCFLWVEELVFFLASFIVKKKQRFVKAFIKAVLKRVRVYIVAGTLHKPGVRLSSMLSPDPMIQHITCLIFENLNENSN